MKKEEFLKKINDHYKEAMKDCQMPTGALANLNATEYYAYCLYLENKRLRNVAEDIFSDIETELSPVTEEQFFMQYRELEQLKQKYKAE